MIDGELSGAGRKSDDVKNFHIFTQVLKMADFGLALDLTVRRAPGLENCIKPQIGLF